MAFKDYLHITRSQARPAYPSRTLLAQTLLASFLYLPLATAQSETQLDIFLGGNSSEFGWNIAGDIKGENPNILSELTWRDLTSRSIGFSASEVTDAALIGVLEFFYSEINAGDNQDSDFDQDGRTNEFRRSLQSADGELVSASYGFGVVREIATLSISPLVGINYERQRFNNRKGETVIATDFPTLLGPIEGLNSSYDSTWIGLWTGLRASYEWNAKWQLHTRWSAHYFDYDAQANWNLRDDFEHPKSFTHDGEGYGISGVIQLSWQLSNRYRVSIRAQSQKWRVDEGTDRVFFATGSELETQLNEVVMTSDSIYFGLGYTP